LRQRWKTLLFHSAQSSANPFDALVEHKRVLNAIAKRDVAGARHAMKALLAGTHLGATDNPPAPRRLSRTVCWL